MPTGNRDLYFLFFLINFVIMAAVGTTLIFLSLIISKTSDMKFSQNASLFFISGTKILVRKIFLSWTDYSIIAKPPLIFVSNCLKKLLSVISIINKTLLKS